jgi:hypothetical protein
MSDGIKAAAAGVTEPRHICLSVALNVWHSNIQRLDLARGMSSEKRIRWLGALTGVVEPRRFAAVGLPVALAVSVTPGLRR